jgi:hypothetical protein
MKGNVNAMVERRILERMALHSQNRIALDLLEPRVDTRLDFSCDEMIVHLQGYVWAEEIQNDTASLTVEWPATVWQAFKERWFPRSWLRRWPVKTLSRTTSHRFVVKAKLPEYKYVAPRECGQAVICVQDPGTVVFRGDKPFGDD